MEDERRAINRGDYDRALVLIYALKAYLFESVTYAAYAAVLESTQEQANISGRYLRSKAGTTERYVKDEIDHAARLVSALFRGETEISTRTGSSEVCSVSGCPRLTESGFDVCMEHWFHPGGEDA